MRVGILLTGDYSWAGGLYYSLNIVKLLHALPVSKNVQVLAIVNTLTPPEIVAELRQNKISITNLEAKPILYKIYHKLTGSRFVADINALQLDVLYPLITWQPSHKKLRCRVLYWLYDFQHKFFPDLFSAEEIKNRDFTFANIATNGSNIVFSSHDSKTHFEQFYATSLAKRHVYNFVSLIEPNVPVAGKTNPPAAYFIVCNQFWPHKNHLLVLKALAGIDMHKRPHIVFTGRFNSDSDYVKTLHDYINIHHLKNSVTFTGFISRSEQLHLMKNSIAVIQPSRFEGWSTVVEDAKALNKFLLLSSLNVHKEQVKGNALFFDTDDNTLLAGYLQAVAEGAPFHSTADYQKDVESSQNELVKLFNI